MESWLLRHGADPNQKCLIDLTPLSYAVHYASISNIKLFLGNGGDTQQRQLLFHALDRESEVFEVLTLLLKEGAPLRRVGIRGGLSVSVGFSSVIANLVKYTKISPECIGRISFE